ncbi:hypothetical protein AB1P65_13530 [Roseibium alexandrii]
MPNLFDEVPEIEPIDFRAGDTVAWRKPDLSADYAPSLYQLDYTAVLETNGATRFVLTATDSGGVFEILALPAMTGAIEAGLYHWTASMTRLSDSAKRTISEGRFEVLPDPTAAVGDLRSHNERMLAQLEALLEGRAKTDAASYAIAGRTITKLSPEELTDWAAKYRRLVRKEKDQRAGKSGRKVHRLRFR